MRGVWCVTKVINHHASEDPSVPKYVTHAELITSALREDTICAESKEEALLKYATSGCCRTIWSVDWFCGEKWLYPGITAQRCKLIKEDF